jgi:hypothetical protein
VLLAWIEDSKEKAVSKARSFGLDIANPEVPCWGVSKEGLDLGAAWIEGGANLDTWLEFGVRRNAVLVVVNPKLGEFLGYQPAAPQVLFPGHFGPVSVKFKSADDALGAFTQLAGDWVVRLCPVQVGSPGRD